MENNTTNKPWWLSERTAEEKKTAKKKILEKKRGKVEPTPIKTSWGNVKFNGKHYITLSINVYDSKTNRDADVKVSTKSLEQDLIHVLVHAETFPKNVAERAQELLNTFTVFMKDEQLSQTKKPEQLKRDVENAMYPPKGL